MNPDEDTNNQYDGITRGAAGMPGINRKIKALFLLRIRELPGTSQNQASGFIRRSAHGTAGTNVKENANENHNQVLQKKSERLFSGLQSGT